MNKQQDTRHNACIHLLYASFFLRPRVGEQLVVIWGGKLPSPAVGEVLIADRLLRAITASKGAMSPTFLSSAETPPHPSYEARGGIGVATEARQALDFTPTYLRR